MLREFNWSSVFFKSVSHSGIAIFISVAMATAWLVRQWPSMRSPSDLILVICVCIAALPLFVGAIQEFLKKNFTVDILALLAIIGALAFREYWVAAIVVLMLSGGRFLEEYATRRASSVLNALARRMPNIAHRLEADGKVTEISASQITIGCKLIIFPHELCPVDGVVVHGNGGMDESYLTGEPYQVAKAPGSSVLSGAINGDAVLRIEATRVASDSRYAKIVEVLHATEKNRPRIRRIGDRLGAWYTPASLGIAILSWALSGDPDRFLAVLVIATPCPLILAIPVAIIGAVSMAARSGIIVKDPSIMERLPACSTLVVDKTGTLTYGKPSLTEIRAIGTTTRESILQYAASLEQYSKHPLAPAILKAARDEGFLLLTPEDVFELPGEGLRAHLEDHYILITARNKLSTNLVRQLPDAGVGLECVMLIDGHLAGVLQFRDEPRTESSPFLQHIRTRHGISQTVLLSGDRPTEVAAFAHRMGITTQYGGQSPEEKVGIVRKLTASAPTIYIGDGINDAPAMMSASAGIALGVNSDITSEAAGAVILESSFQRVDELIHISAHMRRVALTSALGGMFLSIAGMAAGGLGYLTPVEGAVLQEVIDLLAICNSLRMVLPGRKIGDFEAPPSAVGAAPGSAARASIHLPLHLH